MHWLPEICMGGFIFVVGMLICISKTLDKILDLYAKSQQILGGHEPFGREGINDIKSNLGSLYKFTNKISEQMEKLLKIEEEKRLNR